MKDMSMRDISKLPKWVQEHIRDLKRQRETAINCLNDFVDSQTPSPIFYDDVICSGEETGPSWKRTNVQTNQITINHAGVELRIVLRDEAIDIGWGKIGNRICSPVYFIPSAYQQAYLYAKEEDDGGPK